MTNATKSQKHLNDLIDEIGRRITNELEWSKKGLDDSEYSKGQADMAEEFRERLIALRWLMHSDFIELHEQLGE